MQRAGCSSLRSSLYGASSFMAPSGARVRSREGVLVVGRQAPHVTALTLGKGIALSGPAQGWAQGARLQLGTHRDLDVVLQKQIYIQRREQRSAAVIIHCPSAFLHFPVFYTEQLTVLSRNTHAYKCYFNEVVSIFKSQIQGPWLSGLCFPCEKWGKHSLVHPSSGAGADLEEREGRALWEPSGTRHRGEAEVIVV